MAINFTTNQGAQIKSFVYQESAQAKLFNRLLGTLLPAGIYSGFALSRIDATHIQATAGVVLIPDGNKTTDTGGTPLNIVTRIEFTASQEISLDDGTDVGYCNASKPYLVLRFGWNDQVNNFANIVPVAFSNDPSEVRLDYILPTDIVLGKVIFSVSGGHYSIRTTESFDLTRRTVAFLPDGQAASQELRVAASETDVKKVYVKPGSINTSLGRKTVAGGDYPSASQIPDTVAGRWDLVWVDSSGVVQITLGIDSASPSAPPYGTKKAIGEIRRGAGRTDILGPDIYNVDVTRQGQISASDIEIVDAGAYYQAGAYPSGYTAKTVELALQQVYAKLAGILLNGKDGTLVGSAGIAWGTAAGQVDAADLPVVSALFAATDVKAALQELAGAGRTSETLYNLGAAITSLSGTLSGHVSADLSVPGTVVHGIQVDTAIT